MNILLFKERTISKRVTLTHLKNGGLLTGGSPYLNNYYPRYKNFIGNESGNKFLLKQIYNF